MKANTTRGEKGVARPFGALWLVDAPWAHPAWRQYLMSLCDLTTEMGEQPMTCMKGATHEIIVWAVDPRVVIETGERIVDWKFDKALLTPPNQLQQFHADSDDAAVARINQVVELIEAMRLSPDSDAQADWDRLFTGSNTRPPVIPEPNGLGYGGR